MNGLDDLQSMTFEHFAELLEVSYLSSSNLSYVNPKISVSIGLSSAIPELIIDEYRKQTFDEDSLKIEATSLGINSTKLAELIAIRNSWLGYISDFKNTELTFEEVKANASHEILLSYLILSSNKWTNHPWVVNEINTFEDYDHEAHFQRWYEMGTKAAERSKNTPDIKHFIDLYENQNMPIRSWLEVDADPAKYDIKRAKKRIAELHSEIEDQESIINQAMPKIRALKKVEKASIGHPKRTEEQQERSDIAKKFVGQWVNSLMDTLSIGSCGELAKILGGEKMTWWRWKNNKTLPPLRLLEPLLNLKIKSGKQEGVKLCDVQTNPSLRNLISLIELI